MNIHSVEVYAKLIIFSLSNHNPSTCWYHHPLFQTRKHKEQSHITFLKPTAGTRQSWDLNLIPFNLMLCGFPLWVGDLVEEIKFQSVDRQSKLGNFSFLSWCVLQYACICCTLGYPSNLWQGLELVSSRANSGEPAFWKGSLLWSNRGVLGQGRLSPVGESL